MKTYAFLVVLMLFLTGCSGSSEELNDGMELRSNLLQSSSCSFSAEVTADYGDEIHCFKMDCVADSNGDVAFTVIKPDSICGITGRLTGKGGDFLFDETALYFPMMADDLLSPVCAPWIFMKSLRNGYITSACTEDGRIRLSIDDSYEGSPLRLDIWLDAEKLPVCGDVLYDGRRILSLHVEKFRLM